MTEALFIRLLEAPVEEKEEELANIIAAVERHDVEDIENAFQMNPAGFKQIPRAPFAYWASPALLSTSRTIPKTAIFSCRQKFNAVDYCLQCPRRAKHRH